MADGVRTSPERVPRPAGDAGGLVQEDEQEGPDDGRGGPGHQGEEAGGEDDERVTDTAGARTVPERP